MKYWCSLYAKGKTIIAGGLIMCIAFGGLTGCQVVSQKQMQEDFDTFIQQEFVDAMESNWLNVHVFFENPEKFGVDIKKAPIEFGTLITDEVFAENVEKNLEAQKAFEVFDRDSLTDTQKDTYDMYAYMLETALASNDERFRKFDFSFSTLTGVHVQIPQLLSDLELRNEDDVKAVITLIQSTNDFIGGVLDSVETQAENGTLMVDKEEILKYCQKLVDAGMAGSTLKSIKENIDATALDDTLKEAYKKQADEAYEKSMLPAYEAIIKRMGALDDSANVQGGLANIEDGKEYYKLMFRQATGTSKSVAEVQEMLQEMYDNTLRHVQYVATQDTDALVEWMDGGVETKYVEYQDILTDLNSFIEADFPDIKAIDYKIESLPADLENDGIAAYYNIPPLDHTNEQQIFVNSMSDSLEMGSLNTFSLMGHEGLPGHMYQTNYSYNLEDLPVWNKTIGKNIGYTEGYANYVELYVLKYLEEEINPDILKIERDMKVLQNTFVALADIGIHYEGWTLEDLKSMMETYGLNSAVAGEIYEQLRANPTAFLSYYVGYAEFAQLREKAQEKLGDKFSDKEFHEAILKSGSTIFDVVEKNVDAYIKSAK